MEFLFKRGFIISQNRQDKYLDSLGKNIKTKWLRKKIGSYYYYNDPDVEILSYKENNNFITLLGTLIDPVNNAGDSEKIIENLLSFFLKNETDFFNYLDYLSGRFLLLIEADNKKIVLHDASGINAVFYNDLDDEVIISSHTQIIAEIKNYKITGEREKLINSKEFKSKTCYMPGLFTPYKEISILSPNTLIELNEKKIKRFFPRERLKKQKINEKLIKEISNILSNTIELLAKKYKLAVSLTGGIDSRMTLASSKKVKDKIIYFTYTFDNDKGHNEDIELASKVSEIAGIWHEKYFIESEKYTDYLKTFNRNSAYLRSENQGKLAYAIFQKFPKGRMHVKSTVSEIAEGFYLRHYPPIMPFKFLLKYILSSVYRTNKFSGFTHQAFKEFIKKTDFSKIIKYNYNYYDMFYWEHRNGCWQSLQNQDFNIVHDIFIIYNNRYLLKKLLSVSINNRIECTLQFALVKHMWKELLNVRVNSWAPNTLRQKITKIIWALFSPFLP